jgi:hypothetical protein
MKIDVSRIKNILKSTIHDVEVLLPVMCALNEAIAEEDANTVEAPPPVKKQWCILISDPEGVLPKDDLTGWVLQIPENDSVLTTQERIHKAAWEFNITKKGRMLPAETMGDAIENIPAKHFKEQQLWVKSKTPVFALRTDNKIPAKKRLKD